jgi:hypothetical protein
MKKKIVTAIIIVAATAGVLLSAHLLVNYFHIVEVIKAIHGG